MTGALANALIYHDAPGELRAVATNSSGRATHLFSQRWSGRGERARFGSVHAAHIRTFDDAMRGAFCELESGETTFLRLRDRDGLAEGAKIRVKILSEVRGDKHARVALTDEPEADFDAYIAWKRTLPIVGTRSETLDADFVSATFEDALNMQATISGGGRLFIEPTRALTAFDIDSAGRTGRGSAAARALALNVDAISEMARQVSLRGLGGALILDCVSPINAEAGERLRKATRSAFETLALPNPNVLKPSPLGLLQVSLPWRCQPILDEMSLDPAQTELLDVFRSVQREAVAEPRAFFEVRLSGAAWQRYVSLKSDADSELARHFSGRVRVDKNAQNVSEVQKL